MNNPARPHWLIVRPVGVKSNRSAIGTRLVLRAGGVQQTAWVRSGSSYASQSDLRAYFGLGDVAKIDSLEIRWPNGARESLTDVPIDRHLVVREPGARARPGTHAAGAGGGGGIVVDQGKTAANRRE